MKLFSKYELENEMSLRILLSEKAKRPDSLKFAWLGNSVYLPMRIVSVIVMLVSITISATSQVRIVNKDAANGAALIFDGITNHFQIVGTKESDLLGFQGFGLRFTPDGRKTLLATPTDPDSSRLLIFKE